jgi:hypothetical protein
MAWRIQDSVIRPETDNRTTSIVRGRIWLQGFMEPVVPELMERFQKRDRES